MYAEKFVYLGRKSDKVVKTYIIKNLWQLLFLLFLVCWRLHLRHHPLVCHRRVLEGLLPHHPDYYLCYLQL